MPGEMWDTTVISSPSAIEDWTMVVRGKQQEMSAKPARIHHHHHSQSLFGIISDNDYYTSPLRLRGDWNLDNYKNISDREDDGHGGEIVMGCTDGLVTTGKCSENYDR